jgi:hypothetical protein
MIGALRQAYVPLAALRAGTKVLHLLNCYIYSILKTIESLLTVRIQVSGMGSQSWGVILLEKSWGFWAWEALGGYVANYI